MLLPCLLDISVNSMLLCSHSGTNNNFPVRRPQSHSHPHAREPDARTKGFSGFHEPKWNVSAIQSHTLKSSTGTRPPQSCGVNSGCVTKAMPQTLPLLPRATGSKDFWVPSRSPHPVCEKAPTLSLLLLNGAGTWPLLCQNRSRAVPGGKRKGASRFRG
ncbi:hypothetical protein mRhiFer1_009518 [Rhinolophus ferrumequinum]|uniref:Uncharacterized protein n=1 Tax=Rhinolophus ferrumequinum TaxID=59479 RepID=A0A7J7RAQ6_RHIFE|nr:hypothetical protein mRhiFer1_009518 [Rhinolophus ferrumequinum]